MSDEILSSINTFSKKFADPNTNLSFEEKNNISAVVKNGNVNISKYRRTDTKNIQIFQDY